MEFSMDTLKVLVFENRALAGERAAADVAAAIGEMLGEKETLNMIFGAAPSQEDFFRALLRQDIPWRRINAYHMDEYIGISPALPQGFGNFLQHKLFGLASFRSVNLLRPDAEDTDAEMLRYETLLKQNKPDIVCLGIGENGHIAFNDPPADFQDQRWVKRVELDLACRRQQVNDGCFASLEEVPTHAMTLTVPALYSGARLFCIVPAKSKAEAVRRTLQEEISESCPASILRRHPRCVLYLDPDSASCLNLEERRHE